MPDDNFPCLYLMKAAAPSRSVLLTAAALGISLKQVELNLIKGEHLQPFFVKINPQHTVPTLIDVDTTIWDSHVINMYLVSKYGKNSTLYPDDVNKRAIINQRLYFDTSTLFLAGLKIIMPLFRGETKVVDGKLIKEVTNAYDFLETFLTGAMWVAGDTVTIADFSLLTSVTNISVVVPLDSEKHQNILAWVSRMQELPYGHINKDGYKMFKKICEEKMSE